MKALDIAIHLAGAFSITILIWGEDAFVHKHG